MRLVLVAALLVAGWTTDLQNFSRVIVEAERSERAVNGYPKFKSLCENLMGIVEVREDVECNCYIPEPADGDCTKLCVDADMTLLSKDIHSYCRCATDCYLVDKFK